MFDLHFTPEELAANRLGDLTDAQHKWLDAILDLQVSSGRKMVIYFGLLFFLIFGLGSLIELGNAGGDWARLFSRQNLIAAGTILLFLVFTGVLSIFSQRTLLGGLRSRKVRMAEGRARIRRGRVRGTPIYQVTLRRGPLGGKTFRFSSESSLRHFDPGAPYRVYYVAYIVPVPLSAERLDE